MLPKAVRYAVWRYDSDDDYHEVIECAWRADGSSPGTVFCRSMQQGQWRDDPNFKEPRDLDQVRDWASLLAKIKYLGKHGVPARASDVNFLRDGVWEFKHSNRRLTY